MACLNLADEYDGEETAEKWDICGVNDSVEDGGGTETVGEISGTKLEGSISSHAVSRGSSNKR